MVTAKLMFPVMRKEIKMVSSVPVTLHEIAFIRLLEHFSDDFNFTFLKVWDAPGSENFMPNLLFKNHLAFKQRFKISK